MLRPSPVSCWFCSTCWRSQSGALRASLDSRGSTSAARPSSYPVITQVVPSLGISTRSTLIVSPYSHRCPVPNEPAEIVREEPMPDWRVRRTRDLLRRSLVELTLEKGYQRVTVQDILDRADVGCYKHSAVCGAWG